VFRQYTNYPTGWPTLESQFIAETSMLSLDAVQFPIQWVQDALSPGTERSVREAEHLHIGPGIRMHGTTHPFLHTFFCCAQGAVLHLHKI
jgi:hypothetical protein